MGCGKKRRPDYETAIAAAIRCSRRGKPLRVYLCDGSDGNPPCWGWHLSSLVTIARAKEDA